MAIGYVKVTDVDGGLSTASALMNTSSTISGLLFDISGQTNFWTTGQGANIANVFKDTVVALSSYSEAVEMGITDADADTPLLHGIPAYHIKHFFDKAGDGSDKLYVAFADCSTDWSALISMQQASDGTINQFGVWTEQSLWSNMDTTADEYTLNLVSALNAVAVEMADDYHSPAVIVLNANTSKVKTASGTDSKVVLSKIPSCISSSRYVSVVLGQSSASAVALMQGALTSTTPVGIMGLAVGMLSSTNVGNNIGWVSTGDIVEQVGADVELGFGDSSLTSANIITSGTSMRSITKSVANTLDDKGYVFMMYYEGLKGHVYINDDYTCSSGDFNSLSRNRAINRSRRLVRAAFLPYVNSPVLVNPTTGQLTTGQVAEYRNLLTSTLQSMVDAVEISALGTITIDAAQNVLQTKTLNFSYSLIPLGCAKEIKIEDGFVLSR